MGITIDKKVANRFEGRWVETPLAKALAQPFWNHQDTFTITEDWLQGIIKSSVGYQCHKAAIDHGICPPTILDQKAAKTAKEIFEEIKKIIPDGLVDTPKEADALKKLLNSKDLFLQKGGIQINTTSNGKIPSYSLRGLCENRTPSMVRDKVMYSYKFYQDLENFFLKAKGVKFRYKITRPTTKIDIGFTTLEKPDQLYLTLYAGWAKWVYALVVDISYNNDAGKQTIEWKILHKNDRNFEEIIKQSSGKSEYKSVLSSDTKSLWANGKITIEASGLAKSEVQCSDSRCSQNDRSTVYSILSGIFNFLLYSCDDPRVHAGSPVSVISDTNGDSQVWVQLPGL